MTHKPPGRVLSNIFTANSWQIRFACLAYRTTIIFHVLSVTLGLEWGITITTSLRHCLLCQPAHSAWLHICIWLKGFLQSDLSASPQKLSIPSYHCSAQPSIIAFKKYTATRWVKALLPPLKPAGSTKVV